MESRIEKLQERLADTTQALEAAAGTGVVPGELGRWCRTVRERHAALRPVLDEAFRHEAETLGEIRAEDPELARRVAKLREAAEELAARFGRIDAELEELLAREADMEGSAEPTGEVEELRRRTLAWVVDLRAHRGEVRTWYQEAVVRDRGDVD